MTDGSQFETFMDHAADLQREVDRLGDELLMIALAGLALAVACMIMGWQLWHQ